MVIVLPPLPPHTHTNKQTLSLIVPPNRWSLFSLLIANAALAFIAFLRRRKPERASINISFGTALGLVWHNYGRQFGPIFWAFLNTSNNNTNTQVRFDEVKESKSYSVYKVCSIPWNVVAFRTFWCTLWQVWKGGRMLRQPLIKYAKSLWRRVRAKARRNKQYEEEEEKLGSALP